MGKLSGTGGVEGEFITGCLCPNCKNCARSCVVHTQHTVDTANDGKVQRTRKCNKCGFNFKTEERVVKTRSVR